MTKDLHDPEYTRDLGDGLVLRWSRPSDSEALAALYSFVFRDKADEPLNERVAAWTRDLISGRHPLIGPGDFALVEQPAEGRIVAATCLLGYECEFLGARFSFGRPEVVATLPEFRNRGFIRAIFELIHARSAARGHLVQGITGIPYYYRLFGYEYAADLGGARSVYFAAIPTLKPGEPERYTLREATAADRMLINELYNLDRSGAALSAVIDDRYWQWVMEQQDPNSGEGWFNLLIEDEEGHEVGYLLLRRLRHRDELPVIGLGVRSGVGLAAVLPSVLRGLPAWAERVIPHRPDAPIPARVAFILGRNHRVYEALDQALLARWNAPYAWYLRVADLPALLRLITPELERRLAASPAAGHTGELRLTFYRGGLRFVFAGGRLTEIADWAESQGWGSEPQAGFPPQLFLQLLFGYRSLAELNTAYPDVWYDDIPARPLLEALFPPQVSWLLPLD